VIDQLPSSITSPWRSGKSNFVVTLVFFLFRNICHTMPIAACSFHLNLKYPPVDMTHFSNFCTSAEPEMQAYYQKITCRHEPIPTMTPLL